MTHFDYLHNHAAKMDIKFSLLSEHLRAVEDKIKRIEKDTERNLKLALIELQNLKMRFNKLSQIKKKKTILVLILFSKNGEIF